MDLFRIVFFASHALALAIAPVAPYALATVAFPERD